MGISRITFYQAEDTMLYSPLKLAKEQGIFASMFRKHGGDGSIPEIEIISRSGDEEAVNSLFDFSSSNNDEIKIAIADPRAIFTVNKSSEDELRVVGQVITKFPFWIISSGSTNGKLYCPNRSYVTADACASYYRSAHHNVVLKHINEFNVVDEVKRVNGWGLTGQIDRIFEKDITIEAHMASDMHGLPDNFSPLVSVLITRKSVCKLYGKSVLPIVLESVMNAIIILYSSQEIAETTIKSIAPNMNADVVKKIAKVIRSDKFYPHTLDINESDWIDTFNFYFDRTIEFYDETFFPDLKIASQEAAKRDAVLRKYYNIFYNGISARIVERNLIEEFGVTCSTFDTGIDKYIKDRKRDRHRLWMSTYGPFWLVLSLVLLGVGTELLAIYNIFFNSSNDYKEIIPWILSAVSIIIGLLSFYFGPAKSSILNSVKNGRYIFKNNKARRKR